MKPAKLLAIAALLVAAGSSALALWLLSANRQLAADLDGVSKRLEASQAETLTVKNQNAALRQKLADEGIEAPDTGETAHRTSAAAETARLEAVRALGELQKKYDAQEALISSSQSKIFDLQTALSNAEGETRKLAASEADLRESLAGSRRILDAMETEIKAKAERINSLEAALRRARDDDAAADRKLSQIAAIIKSLDEVNRRRENTLTNLLRRFRDLTDNYRALALRLDTQRDNPTPVPITTVDVSRINSAVQSAEEDLRQLNTLNNDAERITRRLRN